MAGCAGWQGARLDSNRLCRWAAWRLAPSRWHRYRCMVGERATNPRWFIAGRAYDLTPWLAKHPGGFDPLVQAQGTDCTILFRTYHLAGVPPEKMLARYEVPFDPTDVREAEAPDRS